jgi:alpha-L-fucosidase
MLTLRNMSLPIPPKRGNYVAKNALLRQNSGDISPLRGKTSRPARRVFLAAIFLAARLGAAVVAGLARLPAHAQAPAPASPPGDDPNSPTYLSTSFREPASDGLRFVWSTDGYHWTEIPGAFLKPWAGPSNLMRDPSLTRGPDGTFHLVWTTGWQGDRGFGYASTKDLVHWSEQRFIPVMQHEPTTVNVWAPELFYDDATEQFIICWASTIPGRFPDHEEPHDNNQRMYYTTTKDFKEFSPAKLFFDPDFSIIDCTIVKANVSKEQPYVLVLKDNSRPTRNIKVAFGETAVGPWTDVSPAFTDQFCEGPTVAKVGDDWLIYYDAYRKGIYGAAKTRDFKTFTDVTSEVAFPKGHKHGTALVVPRSVVDYLNKVGPQQLSNTRLPWTAPYTADEIKTRLAEIDAVANRGPFKPEWDSLSNFKTPAWYRDGKFGIFIHWGAYSVPAFGSEWYPRNMYKSDQPEFKHHIETYGSQKEFGYKDFVAKFKAEKFDAAKWAELFKAAGAKYVIPVAEHHDGFPMYASDYTEWCAAKKGPGRDVIGELSKAIRDEGLTFGASSHRAEHWWFFDHGMRFDSDVRDPANAALYGPAANQRVAESQAEQPDKEFLDDWLLRTCEIVDKYQPSVVYFDWWICQPVFQPYLKRFAAFYYNRGAEWNREVAINFKEWEGRSFPDSTGVFDIERGQSAVIRPDFWQTDTSVSKTSWGYIENQDYRDANSIVDDLVDIVSKNGTLLLNIGPKADGTIPEPEEKMLREVGAWLAINGDAIYGSRPWKIFGEGPTQVVAGSFADVKREEFTGRDFRFTTRVGGTALYAIALAWPEDGKLLVTSLAQGAEHAPAKIESVSLLGHDGEVKWEQTAEGLAVTLPAEAPSNLAATLKITSAPN